MHFNHVFDMIRWQILELKSKIEAGLVKIMFHISHAFGSSSYTVRNTLRSTA